MDGDFPARVIFNPAGWSADDFRRHTGWAAPECCTRVHRFHRGQDRLRLRAAGEEGEIARIVLAETDAGIEANLISGDSQRLRRPRRR